MCRGCWILSARLLNKPSVVVVICDCAAGDFQQDCWVYEALTSWPHKRVAQLSLRHKLSFEPHLYFLLQPLMLQPAPTEQPPQHLLSLAEIWIFCWLKLRSVWNRSEVHSLLSIYVDSAPFSKTCRKRSCTVRHERGCTVWVSVFLFSLLCFAKFNFKGICSILSSLSLSFSLFSSPSLWDVLQFPGSILFGFFPRRWPMWCSLLWEWTVVDTVPALSPFLSHSLSLSLFLLLWVLLSLRYFWRWMEQVLIQLSAPGSV